MAPFLPMQWLHFCATVIWDLYWLWLREPFSTWITEWRGISRRDLNIAQDETDSAEQVLSEMALPSDSKAITRCGFR